MIIILNTKLKKSEKWVEDDFQKESKKKAKSLRSLLLKKKMKKALLYGKVFAKGFGSQAVDPTTMILAGSVGLSQGFKYNGNLKRGLVAGAITMGVMGIIGGIVKVVEVHKIVKSNK